MIEKIAADYAADTCRVIQVKKILEKGLNVSESVIDTIVTAYLFEPGLVDKNDDHDEQEDEQEDEATGPYIFNPPPSSFPKYLTSFAPNDATIVDGPDIRKCSGNKCAGHEHYYLSCEGSHLCAACNKTFCQSCSFVPKFDRKEEKNKPTSEKKYKIYYQDCTEVMCLDCFRLNRLGSSINNNTSTNKSLQEMTRDLSEKFGIQIDPSASIAETTDIYNTYISSPQNNWTHHLNIVQKRVKFPVLPSQSLCNHNNDNDFGMKKIGTSSFNFCDGGRFISDADQIPNEMLPGILNLFRSILEHDEAKLIHQVDSDVGEYSHLPTMLLNFAYNSRVDSGYRLLDRCARHSCDPKTPSFIDASADLFRYEENGKFEKGKRKISFCTHCLDSHYLFLILQVK